MCLVALACGLPGATTLIAANRDEFHQRPSLPLAQWPDAPNVFAGRDVQAGGTWIGLTIEGRYAVVTNYREPGRSVPDARSRGDLVRGFLQGTDNPATYLREIERTGDCYNGFNLIVGDDRGACYYSNRSVAPRALPPGLYLLSNHLLDSEWPKSVRLRSGMARMTSNWREGDRPDLARLTALMKDTSRPLDADLPMTGVSVELERLLSSPFIVSAEYGTRSTTVLQTTPCGDRFISETRYDPRGHVSGATHIAWKNGTKHPLAGTHRM